MKLSRFLLDGSPHLGATLRDGRTLDLAEAWRFEQVRTRSVSPELPEDAVELLRSKRARESVEALIARAEKAAGAGSDFAACVHSTSDLNFLAPTTKVGKIVGVGLNSRSHAAEQGAKLPEQPVLFLKDVGSIAGDGADIVLPSITEALDYEAECGVVMGESCVGVGASEALGKVAAITCLNDVTARDVQRKDRQWFRSKSYPTFCPIGRELVTLDEVNVFDDIEVIGEVNGTEVQRAPLADMVFGVAELIAFISSIVPLEPGDVIATGTPGGVGFVKEPPQFLHPGDTVTIRLGGLTSLTNHVCDAGL